jgi:quinoprotein relay system zinc metallohydrolase 1
MARLDYRLKARAPAPGVWVVEGDNADFSVANGCNIINTGFIATGAGVLVINTGPSRLYGEQLRALIARTTPEPVVQVLHLNLHPDYFLGNQAFADVPRKATAATRAGMAREAAAYETNLYRLCGDWMKGTEALLPDRDRRPRPMAAGASASASSSCAKRGHTASDLVLMDTRSGIVFAGGLVFADRVPTTPHAQLADWLASLQALAACRRWPLHRGAQPRPVHPAAGPGADARLPAVAGPPVRRLGRAGLGHERGAARRCRPSSAAWAAFETEYLRNVAHLYPGYERAALQPRRTSLSCVPCNATTRCGICAKLEQPDSG